MRANGSHRRMLVSIKPVLCIHHLGCLVLHISNTSPTASGGFFCLETKRSDVNRSPTKISTQRVSTKELGPMSKNNLSWITLGIRPIGGFAPFP